MIIQMTFLFRVEGRALFPLEFPEISFLVWIKPFARIRPFAVFLRV